MPDTDIQNLQACIGKILEVHPVHGRDVKGKLLGINSPLKIVYIQTEEGTTVQIPLKRISTIYWPKGFTVKINDAPVSELGEKPTDSLGNHYDTQEQADLADAKRSRKK